MIRNQFLVYTAKQENAVVSGKVQIPTVSRAEAIQQVAALTGKTLEAVEFHMPADTSITSDKSKVVRFGGNQSVVVERLHKFDANIINPGLAANYKAVRKNELIDKSLLYGSAWIVGLCLLALLLLSAIWGIADYSSF